MPELLSTKLPLKLQHRPLNDRPLMLVGGEGGGGGGGGGGG